MTQPCLENFIVLVTLIVGRMNVLELIPIVLRKFLVLEITSVRNDCGCSQSSSACIMSRTLDLKSIVIGWKIFLIVMLRRRVVVKWMDRKSIVYDLFHICHWYS